MLPIIMPPNNAGTASSGFVGLMLGANISKSAPSMINANPPLFLDLLC